MTDDRTSSALAWTPTALPAPTALPLSRVVLPGIEAPVPAVTAVPDVAELLAPEPAEPAEPAEPTAVPQAADDPTVYEEPSGQPTAARPEPVPAGGLLASPEPPPGRTLSAPTPPPERAHPPALAEVMAQPTTRAATPGPTPDGQQLAFRPRADRRATGPNRAAGTSLGFAVVALVMVVAGVIGGTVADSSDVDGWLGLFLLAIVPCAVAFIAGLVGLTRRPRGRAVAGIVLSIIANPILWAAIGGGFG